MTSLPTNPTRMLRFFLLIATTVLSLVLIAALTLHSQQLQRGISVHMAETHNATAFPEADQPDAWIVTVRHDEAIHFGTDRIEPDALAEAMERRPRNREQKLYIKADARAPFSSVQQVMRAARVCLFDDVVLVTAQPQGAQPGIFTFPRGLEVWIGYESEPNPVTVRIGLEQGATTLKVNNEIVAPAALQDKLGDIFDNRAGRIVVLKASGHVAYAQVVQAIDASRAAGATRISMPVSSEI